MYRNTPYVGTPDVERYLEETQELDLDENGVMHAAILSCDPRPPRRRHGQIDPEREERIAAHTERVHQDLTREEGPDWATKNKPAKKCLDLPTRKLALFLRLWKAGGTRWTIARRLRISQWTYNNIRARLALPSRRGVAPGKRKAA